MGIRIGTRTGNAKGIASGGGAGRGSLCGATAAARGPNLGTESVVGKRQMIETARGTAWRGHTRRTGTRTAIATHGGKRNAAARNRLEDGDSSPEGTEERGTEGR